MSSSPTDRRAGDAVVDVVMPQLGVSVAEGTIVEWRKQVGDWVQADETIAEVSTDKIDTEIPSPATGRVIEILVGIEQTVDVGTPLARIATDAAPGEAHAAENGRTHRPVPGAVTGAPAPAARRYSPVVQRIAAEHAVDLNAVPGTGRDGRVTKQDVLAAVSAAAEAIAEAPPDEAAKPSEADAPLHIESPYRPDLEPHGQTLSRMRRSIGEHMKRSLQTAATCTTWIEVDFSRVEHLRGELGITALPLVARCVIGALREFPVLNAWLEDDRHTVHTDVHLGIAVALGEEGLIVPVVHHAQDLSAEGLSSRIRDLAHRARSKQLSPDEVRGGTFTITNPGQYGSIMATPVINQPQVAILDIEAVVKRPVVIAGPDGSDAIAIRPICVLGMSWDHRALDGVLAAQFLAAVRRRIETLES